MFWQLLEYVKMFWGRWIKVFSGTSANLLAHDYTRANTRDYPIMPESQPVLQFHKILFQKFIHVWFHCNLILGYFSFLIKTENADKNHLRQIYIKMDKICCFLFLSQHIKLIWTNPVIEWYLNFIWQNLYNVTKNVLELLV